MKSLNVVSRSLAIVALSLTTLAVSANSFRTETVLYQGKFIPSVSLKEVVISASPTKSKAVLCAMQLHDGVYIPSVNLDEISVSASGSVSHMPLLSSTTKADLLPTILVDGEYIANVDLNEVQVFGALPSTFKQALIESSSSDNNNKIFKVSMRKGFDRLLNYLMLKGKEVVVTTFPSLFTK